MKVLVALSQAKMELEVQDTSQSYQGKRVIQSYQIQVLVQLWLPRLYQVSIPTHLLFVSCGSRLQIFESNFWKIEKFLTNCNCVLTAISASWHHVTVTHYTLNETFQITKMYFIILAMTLKETCSMLPTLGSYNTTPYGHNSHNRY